MRIRRRLVYFSNLQWLLLSLAVVFLDFVTKQWIISNCVLGKSIFVTSFMNFHYVYNFGIAFSLFSEFGAKQNYILLFVIVSIILLLCVILCFFNSSYGSFFKIAYAIIIGGALGNLIDRIYYGVVVDFIDCHIRDWHFPIFNIADLSIFIGVVMVLLYNYR